MEISTPVQKAADRLGLALEDRGDILIVCRQGWRVEVDAAPFVCPDAPPSSTYGAAWLLLGIRLGIDKRIRADDNDPYTPMEFRRTSLRRYTEAPSVHGDHLPLLIPHLTRKTFETVADTTAFCRPWLQPDLEVMIIEETGKRLEVLTENDQQRADESDDERWRKVRSALFYQSYKLRPKTTDDVAGGRLRVFETPEGFGASRALLLPDYDYDASREHGYLAVPTRDRIIIARPTDRNSAEQMLPALGEAIEDSFDDTSFGLSDAVFELAPNDVSIHTESTVELSEAIPPPQECIGETSPP